LLRVNIDILTETSPLGPRSDFNRILAPGVTYKSVKSNWELPTMDKPNEDPNFGVDLESGDALEERE
jgi:hypothetical protein